jgi:membrane protein YqaA with SNARE-associated domain
MRDRVLSVVVSVIGGVVGGALGYFLFDWVRQQGFYALMLPGTLIGVGASLLVRNSCRVRGLICALAALALGFYTEWRFSPFLADKRLSYFLSHAYQLKPVTLLMIALGGGLAYWIGKDAGPFGLVGSRDDARR